MNGNTSFQHEVDKIQKALNVLFDEYLHTSRELIRLRAANKRLRFREFGKHPYQQAVEGIAVKTYFDVTTWKWVAWFDVEVQS